MRNKSIALATLMAAAAAVAVGIPPAAAAPTPRRPEARNSRVLDEERITAAQAKRDRKAAKRLAAHKDGGA